MKTKKCTNCNEEKIIDKFSFRNKIKNTYQSECKNCFKLRDRERWDNNPELLSRKRKQQKIIRDRNRSYINNYKKAHPCVDCDESDFIVLEFDHVINNKEANICEMLTTSLEALKLEISKCEVRCANCHKRRHYMERLGM